MNITDFVDGGPPIEFTETADTVDMSLGMDFPSLTREEQAVLAYMTLLCLRSYNGAAALDMVANGLAMAPETVQAILANLFDKSLAWGVRSDGDCTKDADYAETSIAQSMSQLAVGPGGRPNARSWTYLRGVVFSRFFGSHTEPHCVYCATPTPEAELVLDHMIPVSRGGSNHVGNLVPACAPCNGSKGNKSHAEWYPTRPRRR